MAGQHAADLDDTCGGLLPRIGDDTQRAAAEAVGGVLSPWLSRGELRARALSLAARFPSDGKRLVVLAVRNGLAGLTGLLAARAAGHAVALVDTATPSDRLMALLDAYRPDDVVTDAGQSLAGTANWSNVNADGLRIATQGGDLGEVYPSTAILLSTSGTTGSSKFVRLAEAAVTANADQIARALAISSNDVGAAHLPLHYSYGLSVVTSHLVAGAAVALMDDSITSPTFWKAIGAAEATQFPGVPFHYVVLARLGLKRIAPASLTCFTQAGGALDLKIQQAIHGQAAERGARFHVMYGQTEAAPRITTMPSDALPSHLGSVGPALHGGRLRILDAGGGEAPQGQIGEVAYEGPNVMLGYADGRADLAVGDITDGRILTGDLGYLDSDGFLFLTGRAKRFAKVYGLRINLDEVERRIGPAAAAVDVGEQIVIFHEAGPGAAALPATISEVAAEYRLPSAVFISRIVEAIPRKDSGKVDYAAVREMV
jgi:acyl-CoA synthetase (AMP-forming)/AMP-acid ligase II